MLFTGRTRNRGYAPEQYGRWPVVLSSLKAACCRRHLLHGRWEPREPVLGARGRLPEDCASALGGAVPFLRLVGIPPQLCTAPLASFPFSLSLERTRAFLGEPSAPNTDHSLRFPPEPRPLFRVPATQATGLKFYTSGTGLVDS